MKFHRINMALLLALGFALTLSAATATAQEVQEGQWIKLFDGEGTYGWTNFGDVPWSVKDGALVSGEGYSGFLATTSRFTDFELVIKAELSGEGAMGVVVRGGLEGHASANGGADMQVKAAEGVQEINIRALGSTVKATINGAEAAITAPTRSKGHILIEYQRSQGDKVPMFKITEAKLRPLQLKSLFNGKDLSGWNIIPEHKSVFSVVDGALNIKNGNGQIETAGTYMDFVLQMDIYSNGDHLNSGVFFRGPVGVFWKGYESQVRNQWEGEDRTKPVDTGTGGMYGIDPARKVVSSDREWFSKTIVCDENHFSVWINGYLVSDFFETRAISEDANGKAGYVNKAGTIHLQGHDPTTDLSFKNINIGVYPEK